MNNIPVSAADVNDPMNDTAVDGSPEAQPNVLPAPPQSLPAEASVIAPAELSLTQAQASAIAAITTGSGAAEAARKAGVHRTTLYRWLTQDPAFRAALNAWQNDTIASARNRIIAMTDAALTALEGALQKGDARAALAVLQSLGALAPHRPASDDPADLDKAARIARSRGKLKLEMKRVALITRRSKHERDFDTKYAGEGF